MLGLLQRIGALLAPTTFVFLALLKVRRPPEVVDVDLGAVCIEVEHLVDRVAEELDVVGDDHDAAGERLNPVTQPHDRVVIEVIRGLIQEEYICIGEEHACQLDAATLAAGEGIEGLVEDAILETKGMSDLRRLGVGSPPSGVRELLIELDVALHGTLLPRALGRRHLVFGLADARDDRVDAAHRDNAIAGLHLWVTDVSVLCEVADGAVGRDGSGVLGGAPAIGLACEEAHRRGLTGAVTADQTNAHAFIDTETCVVDELTGTDTQ